MLTNHKIGDIKFKYLTQTSQTGEEHSLTVTKVKVTFITNIVDYLTRPQGPVSDKWHAEGWWTSRSTQQKMCSHLKHERSIEA